jgi:N-acetylglucosamine kinase-like BadF-type ATPase
LYIATLDGGKTKTVCAILDDKGKILSYTAGAAVGTSLLDPRTVELNLRTVFFDALERSSLSVDDIGVASFTICDLDTEKLRRSMKRMILRLGCKEKVLLEPDYVGAYYIATHGKPGVGVIAGTGAMAYGENTKGDRARTGGWGWFIDDEGCGIWIGVRALNAVAREYDGMGKKTLLTEMLCREFDLRDSMDVMNIAYKDGNAEPSLASRIAPLVDHAAQKGDHQSIQILRQAAREVSVMTLTVAKKLGLEKGRCTIGCIGSVFKSEIFTDTFKELVRSETEAAEFTGPYIVYRPLMGPVIMAFSELKGRSTAEPLYGRIKRKLDYISEES